MTRRFLLFQLFSARLLLCTTSTFSQAHSQKGKFLINGEISSRDTGKVVLWYANEKNEGLADTVALRHGAFVFSGTVNRACEARLWTNLHNRNVDDPSVTRFLLEPGKITILKNDDSSNATIRGSALQSEKEQWDSGKSSLLAEKDQYYTTLYSLNDILKKGENAMIQKQVSDVYGKIDSVNKVIREWDLGYIRNHPNSFLSGYLLFQHCRRIPLDSARVFYSALATEVKNSSVGFRVLEYIFPLLSDDDFRKANPLVSKNFTQRLSEIRSVHDLSLKDTAGKLVDFRSFKGKYLVIGFWATWCTPCVANIPAWNRLTSEYPASRIAFVSVSLDNDTLRWKKFLAKHIYKSTQLIDPDAFFGLLAVYSKTIFVSNYIIADPGGKIIKYASPTAGDPALNGILDGLVK